jgi:hypothetical protein
MCFVWIWEQTAIISLYSTNLPDFITETESVYCAVRNGSLFTIRIEFSLDDVMVQVASCLRPNAKTRIWSQFSPSEICGVQSGSGTGFSSCTPVCHFQHHSTSAPHSSSPTCCSYQKDKRAKPGILTTKLSSFLRKSLSIGYKSVHCHPFLNFERVKSPKRMWSETSKVTVLELHFVGWIEIFFDRFGAQRIKIISLYSLTSVR